MFASLGATVLLCAVELDALPDEGVAEQIDSAEALLCAVELNALPDSPH